MSKEKQSLKIGRYSVNITTPDRILFPDDKITKLQLIEYYLTYADYITPHTKNRPLTMHRFPEGIEHEGFYQKNAAEYFPRWIKTVPVVHENRTVHYVVGNNAATLAYLANQACITFHLWLSKINNLHKPDRIIFDLDPSGTDFNQVRRAAFDLRELLEDELGLVSFVMTTGSRGLHVLVPLKQKYDFDFVHNFTHAIAHIMVARNPKDLTLEVRKDKRKGKIFVDYLRNSFSATAVAPYSVRAKSGAPVATPLYWQEAEDKKLHPQKYTLKNIDRRLEHMGDPWQNVMKHACSLRKAEKVLFQLLQEHKAML